MSIKFFFELIKSQYFFILNYFVKPDFKGSDYYIPIGNNTNIPDDKSNFVADNPNLDHRISKHYVEMKHIFHFRVIDMDNNVHACGTQIDNELLSETNEYRNSVENEPNYINYNNELQVWKIALFRHNRI